MATPNDDELRTIGLPRGVIQDVKKAVEAAKAKPADPPAFDPRRPDADESPARRGSSPPSARRDADRPDRGARPIPESDILATVPPVGGRRPASPPPPAANARPAESQRPRPPAGSPGGGAPRSEPPPAVGRGPARDPRREMAASVERLLDESDSDFSTNQMPWIKARPGSPAAPAQPGLDAGNPFPDETCAGALQPAATPFPDESHLTDTPDGFAGSSDDHPRAQVPPPPPKKKTYPQDHLDPENKYEQTMAIGSPLIRVAGTRSTLQFFHSSNGRWVDLGEVGREGRVLGRDTFHLWDANPQGLAEEHLRIDFEGEDICVEPLETLNGVYRKLTPQRREELLPRTRFRIGRHVLEFRLADPPSEIPPLRSSDGEVFQTRVLVPLGFIDLIGPNGRAYLSFPVTKREERGTRIGRAGVECDVALTGDEWVSLRHARIFFHNEKWWLEDLESTNGTYLIVDERTPLRRGTTRHPASGDEILVGGYKIRVIEEKA